jgi:spermidine synthase
MSEVKQAPFSASSGGFYPLLLCLFIGSGLAALIYEIVWFQLLEFVIGSTAASLAVLLATFMGGMCLGSLAFPRLIPASIHPLRIYAVMELAVGAMAVLVLYGLPPASSLYASVGGFGVSGLVLRALLCVVFLLGPTVLMGATLPCAARWVEASPNGTSWVGILYTGNLAGAVVGCLLAGFYLLRLHDMATANFVAAAVNVACGITALLLAAVAPYRAALARTAVDRPPPPWHASVAYFSIGLSGLTALGAQVVWTRLLSLLLGPSVYTFSIILAVFLLGLGLGSTAASLYVRSGRNALAALGWCQFLLIAGLAWAALSIDFWLPYWPVDPRLTISPWLTFQLDLARVLWAVLPAACLWGASFPLAIAAVARQQGDAGRSVGAVYAANTVGAIIGAVGFSIVVIPAIGTFWAERILMSVAALSAVAVLLAALVGGAPAAVRYRSFAAVAAGIVAVALVTALLTDIVPPPRAELYTFGRTIMKPEFESTPIYVGEGRNASFAVSEDGNGVRYFHVAGKTEASSHPIDMRLQRMLADLAGLVDRNPKSVLVVGFGAGVTAGSFVPYPQIQRIVICEIEPRIPQFVSGYFRTENFDVLHDPRVQIVYDDARHFIFATREKFDIITSDPIHPWVKGSASLYTRDYFELVKRHLKPGGVVTQWVPLYESTPEAIKSEMATFFSVFPDGLLFLNGRHGASDVVMFAQAQPEPINLDDAAARFDGTARIAKSLQDIGFTSAIDLFSSYAGQADDLAGWLDGATVSTDRNLRLQYLAGLGLNTSVQDDMIFALLRRRRSPEGLFVGSPETLGAFSDALEKNTPVRRQRAAGAQ